MQKQHNFLSRNTINTTIFKTLLVTHYLSLKAVFLNLF